MAGVAPLRGGPCVGRAGCLPGWRKATRCHVRLHVDDGHGNAYVAARGGLEGAEQDFHDLAGFLGAAGGGAAVVDEVDELDDGAGDVALGVLGVGDVGGDQGARFVHGGEGGSLLGDAQDAVSCRRRRHRRRRAWGLHMFQKARTSLSYSMRMLTAGSVSGSWPPSLA